MGVSKNNGTPKSSILIGFSIINHYKPSILGYPYFGNIPIFWGPFPFESVDSPGNSALTIESFSLEFQQRDVSLNFPNKLSNSKIQNPKLSLWISVTCSFSQKSTLKNWGKNRRWTLPSLKLTAKAPEIWWWEDEFPFGMAYFQGRTVSFRGKYLTFGHLFFFNCSAFTWSKQRDLPGNSLQWDLDWLVTSRGLLFFCFVWNWLRMIICLLC